MINLFEKAGLGKLQVVVAYGFAISLTLAVAVNSLDWVTLTRWLHAMSGVMWIGLLWYFNFVQAQAMPRIPDEQKPAITKIVAPAALFWFRWAAISTMITGLMLLQFSGDLVDTLLVGTIGGGKRVTLNGIGLWLGLIMVCIVWFIMWPNLREALGLISASPEERKVAARKGALASRINTMLSFPMLYFMIASRGIY